MPADPRLDDWLDRWEALKERGLGLTPDEFLAGFGGEIPTPLAERFKREVAALGRVDERMGLAGSPPDTAPLPDGHGPPDAGREPVPGYVLVERLGQGGFGEVWKAKGPGGFHV